MPKEIERKYLLRALPAGIAESPSAEYDQGYLPGTEIHERIRRVRTERGARYYRTIKLGTGMDRFEFEDETDAPFFDATWPLTVGRRVHKRRYRLEAPGGVWEVDEFLDRDLVLAELELSNVDQRIDMPDVITAVLDRDVTDDEAYANYRLAK